jgi:hypothetical protein
MQKHGMTDPNIIRMVAGTGKKNNALIGIVHGYL